MLSEGEVVLLLDVDDALLENARPGGRADRRLLDYDLSDVLRFAHRRRGHEPEAMSARSSLHTVCDSERTVNQVCVYTNTSLADSTWLMKCGQNMARLAKGDEIMHQRRSAFLGVLVVAAITVGCGPTDDGIGTKVKTNLTADETVKAAQIDVGVQKKVVTLSGTVETPAVKERAVAVARKTDGVADVIDQITIKQQGFGPGPGHGGEMMGRGMTEGKDRHGEGKRE